MAQIRVFHHISNIRDIFNQYNPNRIFLVSGNKSYTDSGAKDILGSYFKGFEVFEYSDFSINPKIEDVINGARLVNKFKPQLMIAVGGGSVLDTAKLIASLPADLNRSLSIITGKSSILLREFPLIAIPTTAGSGSESTHFAVVYLNGVKYSVADQSLIPEYAILEPELTYSMSKRLTAITALDAFSQAIESYWAVGTTHESRNYARQSIELIRNNYYKVVSDPDKHSRALIMKASFLAGKAINITKTTAPHAFSYGLTSNYNIPHGHAVALTLGKFILLHMESTLKIYNDGVNEASFNKTMTDLLNILGFGSALQADRELKNMLIAGGLETELKYLGVKDKNDINNLSLQINTERLNNHPIKINREIAYKIFNDIY